MDDHLLKRLDFMRVYLGVTVVVGMLVAVATIVQMVFLSKIVDRVFVGGEDLAAVTPQILALSGAVVVRAGLLWVREVTAQRGAVRVKSELREQLLSQVFRLGPAYAAGERSAELVTPATEGVAPFQAPL